MNSADALRRLKRVKRILSGCVAAAALAVVLAVALAVWLSSAAGPPLHRELSALAAGGSGERE